MYNEHWVVGRQVVAYKGFKQRKSIKPWSQKVVAVAHKRCSFSRESKNGALTEKILVVWIHGRLDEDVAYKR